MSESAPKGLKPDITDRPNIDSGDKVEKRGFSRRYLTIGLIVVLLVVVIIAIISSLNSLDKEKNGYEVQTGIANNARTSSPIAIQPQEIAGQPIAAAPTTAERIPDRIGQQRVEIPDEVINALSGEPSNPANQPLASATSESAVTPEGQPLEPIQKPVTQLDLNHLDSSVLNRTPLASLPANYFTIQLSGATQKNTLEAFAKKQQLGQYWIYETRRSGKSWFVLITGFYATSSTAKSAITSLPPGVQKMKPWVKPLRQVHKELKQR